MMRFKFRDDEFPMVGVGTWCIGDEGALVQKEINCIKTAVEECGMTLIDTAEMYGYEKGGASERLVGKALEKIGREKVFLVDKILPENAYKGNFEKCVRRSLERTGAEYFDLYLLHWRANTVLQDVVDEMEALVEKGLIKRWGVSNFDVDDMEELFACQNGNHCYANQFLYNISSRGVEYDLIPWCKEHNVLPMIYSPLGDTREKQLEILENPAIKELCEKKDISITNLMLKFVIRNRDLITIFKTSSIDHLKENIKTLEDGLTDEDMAVIDSVFAPPTEKMPLEKI